MNPETRSSTSNASRYSNNVLYDVLPFEDDTDIMNHDNRASRSRDSQWAGWLKDLDSIKVKQFSAYDTDSPADGSTLVDGRDVTIWVGPTSATPPPAPSSWPMRRTSCGCSAMASRSSTARPIPLRTI